MLMEIIVVALIHRALFYHQGLGIHHSFLGRSLAEHRQLRNPNCPHFIYACAFVTLCWLPYCFQQVTI